MRILSRVSAAAAALVFAGLCVPANAQHVNAGRLDCRGGPAQSFIVGSVTTLDCMFTGQGRPAHYQAIIRRAGVDLAITNETRFTWLVLAPALPVYPGTLAGWYGGVTAGVTLGVGGNLNVLVGGPNNTFALQPISAQGQTGLAVAATVTGLELMSAGPERRWKRKARRSRR